MNTSSKIRISAGKVLYGFLFVALLPFLLVVWAYYTSGEINLPVPSNHMLIYVTLVVGGVFVVLGMQNLASYGKGLPMNAYPPKYYVIRGVYAISQNPIYLGSIILSFSISALLQSPSGFWLVSPLFTLMVVAYTLGFENERTLKVFGEQTFRPFLSLPVSTADKLTLVNRLASYIIVYLPWFLIYEAFIFIGTPKDAIVNNLPFEKYWPVIEFTTVFYISVYLFAALVPWILKTKSEMRAFAVEVWLATGISAIMYFTLPIMANQTEFVPKSFWGELLLLDRSLDGESAAFPAFHVIWAFLAARYFSLGIKSLKWAWYLFAVLISISCITTGCHSLLDVLAGMVVFALVCSRSWVWNLTRRLSERIANSWKEWRFGPVRVINHGFYAGMSGFIGIVIVACFLGSKNVAAGVIPGVFGVAGAALWAQFVEGSPKLQRPYGYYGSLVGVIVGSVVAVIFFPVKFQVLMGAYAVAAPWIQILGRLRCLVQGCCHGKPTALGFGLRFTHPLSRVNKISGLIGMPLHPTQLYSIASNFISGLILIRLVGLEMPAVFIIGLYLILNGLGRFVEEYFRGEAQTPYWMGMRIYQWIAIVNIVAGAVLTALPATQTLTFQFNLNSVYWALAMGVFSTVAYGVDFPGSNRRFARLTSA